MCSSLTLLCNLWSVAYSELGNIFWSIFFLNICDAGGIVLVCIVTFDYAWIDMIRIIYKVEC